MQEEDDGRAGSYCQSEREEFPVVSHDINAKNGQMAYDGTSHHTQGENSTQPSCPGNQQENGSDQLRDSGADPAGGSQADLIEDVNGFGCCGKFEPQCLGENDRRSESEDPGKDREVFGQGTHVQDII